jgi:alpha-glucuronidase
MTEISKDDWDDNEHNTIVWYKNSVTNQLLVFFDDKVYGHVLKSAKTSYEGVRHDRFFKLTEQEVIDMVLPRII